MLDPWRHLQGTLFLANTQVQWDEWMEIIASVEASTDPDSQASLGKSAPPRSCLRAYNQSTDA